MILSKSCIDPFFMMQTPESHTGKASKSQSNITASEQFDKVVRKRICGDASSHDDSPVPNSQETNPNPKTQDQTVQLLMESLRSYDFQPESDNDPTDHVKAQKHQVHCCLVTETQKLIHH